jgi:hypothetical protein
VRWRSVSVCSVCPVATHVSYKARAHKACNSTGNAIIVQQNVYEALRKSPVLTCVDDPKREPLCVILLADGLDSLKALVWRIEHDQHADCHLCELTELQQRETSIGSDGGLCN